MQQNEGQNHTPVETEDRPTVCRPAKTWSASARVTPRSWMLARVVMSPQPAPR